MKYLREAKVAKPDPQPIFNITFFCANRREKILPWIGISL